MENETIEPVREEFTNGTETYVYDANLIGMQQAVLAEETLRFKFSQEEKKAETWEDVLKSGGATWFIDIMAALLCKVENDKQITFTIITWEKAKDFVRKLNYKEYARLQTCRDHFFLSIQKDGMLSQILTPKSTKRSETVFSMLLEKMIDKNILDKNISTKQTS